MAKKKVSSKKSAAKQANSEKKGRDEHGSKGVSAALKEIESDFDDTEAAEGGNFEDIPSGKYQVRIDKADVNHAQSSGRLQVSWELTVCGGDFANRKLWKHDGIDNEKSIGFFKQGIERLGHECPKAKKLPAFLQELVGTYAEVTVRVKKNDEDPENPFRNVYFNKALDEDEVNLEGLDEVDEDGAEEEEEEMHTFSKGDRVTAVIDGETYAGKVIKVNDDEDEAKVKFDDGDVQTLAMSDLSPEDEEEEEDEEESDEEESGDEEEADEEEADEEEADDDDGEEEEEESDDDDADEEEADEEEEEEESGVVVKFKKLAPAEEKTVKSMAKRQEFDPKDYDDMVSLLADIAEYFEIKGTFKKASELITKCLKVEKKKG